MDAERRAPEVEGATIENGTAGDGGKLALIVSYDGSDFAGSQAQADARTVQAEIERALAHFAGRSVPAVFAGRTDRGVHAVGQVVGCDDARPNLEPEAIRRALNARLPEDVAVQLVERRDAAFHARYDAIWREYRYRLRTGTWQPNGRGTMWQRSGALDLDAMRRAAAYLIGEHDLASFAGGGEGVPWSERHERPRGTIRRVVRCDCRAVEPLDGWSGLGDCGRSFEVRVVADGFLPRMVRNIVGALVEIGRGVRTDSWIDELLTARDRRHGPKAAPPHGLVLWRVGYGNDTPDGSDGGPTEADVTKHDGLHEA